jgi:GNAT superfamily N-acetyltransferase
MGEGKVTAEDVVIRRGVAGDLAALTALVSGAGLPTAGLPDAWGVWVAVEEDEVVGGCVLERHTDSGREPPAYLLRSLVTSPRMRGRGAGSRLSASEELRGACPASAHAYLASTAA